MTDYQSEYATDAAIDALETQGEAFEKEKDKEIKATEKAAEEEVAAIKAKIDDEAALRQAAIAQIDLDYQTMLDNVSGYFSGLGDDVDGTLLSKLREGLGLISQYGSYDGALIGIGSNAGNLDSAAIAALMPLVQQMKNNSTAWHTSDDAEKSRLASENERIAEMLEGLGFEIWKKNGVWYIRINGQDIELFKYAGVFHSGGKVGDGYAPKADELFALLKRGEVVLNEDQQSSLLGIFNNAGKWMQNQMAKTVGSIIGDMRGKSFFDDGSRFASFAPNIEVNITHNGSMSDADAKRYGNQVATAALDHLWNTLNKRGIT